MKFFQIVTPLLAICVGLIVWTETSKPQKSAEVPANSPASGAEGPTAGNLLTALGIALGGDGGMNSVGGGSNDPRLVTDPLRTRKAEFYGWNVRHPGMTGPGDSVHLVQSALSSAPIRPALEYPASIRSIPTDPNCAPPSVGPGEKLTKVQIFSQGELATGYHAITDTELAKGAAEYLRKLQREQNPETLSPPSRTKAVPVANVVITDESAPLYLVLQSGSGQVLWNLHATPGVEIARIVLIGNPGQAVRPLAPDTPVTMLNISADCAPQPWRDMAQHWARHPNDRADMKDSGGATFREKAAGYYDRYNTWFEANFGEAAEPGTIGAYVASHVLVGPLPASIEARAPYRPLAGTEIIAHAGPLLYVTPEADRRRDIAQRRHALALEAAGGDLSILNPEPMERTQ